MTPTRDNPNMRREKTLRPVTYVLQVRNNRYEEFKTLRAIGSANLDRYREDIAKINATAGYQKYRIVSR